jgi:hypothetical protein
MRTRIYTSTTIVSLSNRTYTFLRCIRSCAAARTARTRYLTVSTTTAATCRRDTNAT